MYYIRLNNVGFKANPIVTQKKLTQDLVAGNPKSVIRQNLGVKARLGLMHLKRAAATLTPEYPWDAYIWS